MTCNSYRNPQLLADMARTVDHISARNGEGRLILGIGSGWFAKDYEEYGYEFGTPGGRLANHDRDLPLIRERFARLNPAPTRDIPILIGGGGEKKTLRIVAQHAQIWHSFGDADTLRHKNAVLDEWCAKVGRDPREIERSGAADAKAVEASAEAGYEVGTRLFTIGVGGPNFDLGAIRDLVAWRDDKNG